MEKITFDIEIAMPIGSVYEIMTTLGGLRSWYSRDITGDPKKGGELKLGFGEEQATHVAVTDYRTNKMLKWTVLRSTFSKNAADFPTLIQVTFSESGSRGTLLSFSQSGWNEITEFYRISGYQWEKALQSLKLVCETGRGEPLTHSVATSRKATGWFPVS
ncbi:MAG: SRPBCC domain-containing protein [Patescibacteria group bacterium]